MNLVLQHSTAMPPFTLCFQETLVVKLNKIISHHGNRFPIFFYWGWLVQHLQNFSRNSCGSHRSYGVIFSIRVPRFFSLSLLKFHFPFKYIPFILFPLFPYSAETVFHFFMDFFPTVLVSASHPFFCKKIIEKVVIPTQCVTLIYFFNAEVEQDFVLHLFQQNLDQPVGGVHGYPEPPTL